MTPGTIGRPGRFVKILWAAGGINVWLHKRPAAGDVVYVSVIVKPVQKLARELCDFDCWYTCNADHSEVVCWFLTPGPLCSESLLSLTSLLS